MKHFVTFNSREFINWRYIRNCTIHLNQQTQYHTMTNSYHSLLLQPKMIYTGYYSGHFIHSTSFHSTTSNARWHTKYNTYLFICLLSHAPLLSKSVITALRCYLFSLTILPIMFPIMYQHYYKNSFQYIAPQLTSLPFFIFIIHNFSLKTMHSFAFLLFSTFLCTAVTSTPINEHIHVQHYKNKPW